MGKGTNKGSTNISIWEIPIYKRTISNDSGNDAIEVSASFTPGIDVGWGRANMIGADLEVSFNPELIGINVELSGSFRGSKLDLGSSIGLKGVGGNLSYGAGMIYGRFVTVETSAGMEGSYVLNLSDGYLSTSYSAFADTSIGLLLGSLNLNANIGESNNHSLNDDNNTSPSAPPPNHPERIKDLPLGGAFSNPPPIDPLVIDLDGDGVKETTTWAAVDDGFLVVDLDETGENSANSGPVYHVQNFSKAA